MCIRISKYTKLGKSYKIKAIYFFSLNVQTKEYVQKTTSAEGILVITKEQH